MSGAEPGAAAAGEPVVDPVTDSARALDLVWRSLVSFCIYRLVIIVILAATYWGFNRFQVVGSTGPLLAASVIGGVFFSPAPPPAPAQTRAFPPALPPRPQSALPWGWAPPSLHASPW